MKPCKDCLADAGAVANISAERVRVLAARRPAPHPGPRCASHHRAESKRRKLAAHASRTEQTYGITGADYWAIYEFQGGRCALCQLATGKARRLAVDHDHVLAKAHDHPVDQGCRLCVRGLLCKRCNRYGVPLNPDAVSRAVNYLAFPPARQVLAGG